MSPERKQRGRVEDAPPPPIVEFTLRVTATYKSAYGGPKPADAVISKVVQDLTQYAIYVGNADYKVTAEVLDRTDERTSDADPADAPEAAD